MKAKVSNIVPDSFYKVYSTNLNYLQNIKLLGSNPYPLKTYINKDTAR